MTISITGPNAKPAAHGRAAQRGGFTLLELVLVMVIIGTTLGMASVSLRGFFASRRTADAAAQMVVLAKYARTRAAVDGQEYRLNIDAREGRYWLTARPAGSFEPLGTDIGRVYILPEGTVARWIEPPSMSDPGAIPFYPDGRTIAARLRLTGRQGETADVHCPSPTERFSVIVEPEGDSR